MVVLDWNLFYAIKWAFKTNNYSIDLTFTWMPSEHFFLGEGGGPGWGGAWWGVLSKEMTRSKLWFSIYQLISFFYSLQLIDLIGLKLFSPISQNYFWLLLCVTVTKDSRGDRTNFIMYNIFTFKRKKRKKLYLYKMTLF